MLQVIQPPENTLPRPPLIPIYQCLMMSGVPEAGLGSSSAGEIEAFLAGLARKLKGEVEERPAAGTAIRMVLHPVETGVPAQSLQILSAGQFKGRIPRFVMGKSVINDKLVTEK